MPTITLKPSNPVQLRARAQSSLIRPVGLDDTHASAANALRVLHDLASSPETASDALALLHELQVHQVELDLQAEDLRTASVELETALARQVQLFDAAPVAYLVVDPLAQLLELNAKGAQQLGLAREALIGQRLDRFLTAPSCVALHQLLALVLHENATRSAVLVLQGQDPALSTVTAIARVDPAGTGCLLVLCPASEQLLP